MAGLTTAWGKWLGSAEVFDGLGHFVGNGMDMRHVQNLGDGRTRIDVTFIGPFKASGHYYIQDHGDYRLYQGPINVGYAEVLAENLIDATAYWSAIGMTQRFFLMILPEQNRQLSFAQLSRGDQLIYSVVGENQRVDETVNTQPSIINGAEFDLHADPTAGRGELLVHRSGTWQGTITTLDSARQFNHTDTYSETLCPHPNGVHVQVNYGQAPLTSAMSAYELTLITNQWQAWTGAGAVVGSYNLCGGRALSGYFNHVESGLRVWRREVVSHDGTQKALVHHWYRGHERLSTQYGVLQWEAQP